MGVPCLPLAVFAAVPYNRPMAAVLPRNRLFVGTVPTARDRKLLEQEQWYRVPVDTVRDREAWPPAWFAPWETTAARPGNSQQVSTLWRVSGVEEATREQLFPEEETPANRRGKRYWRLALADPAPLAAPILTTRRRQSVFIYSDVRRLAKAESINDLWHTSALEEGFWKGLKQRQIPAERQWATYGQKAAPAIFDFAVFCNLEDIDIEVDGDQHHTVPEISRRDARRDNVTQLRGFRTLRFDSRRVRRDLNGCLNDVERMIHQCGGLERAEEMRPVVARPAPGSQLPLFEPAKPRAVSTRRRTQVPPGVLKPFPEGEQTTLL